jgi:hypothetical protein
MEGFRITTIDTNISVLVCILFVIGALKVEEYSFWGTESRDDLDLLGRRLSMGKTSAIGFA